MQQRAAKVLLQAPYLLAYGRLGAVNAFTSAGKAAGVHNRDEAAKQIQIEHLTCPFGFPLITILTFNFRMATRAPHRLHRGMSEMPVRPPLKSRHFVFAATFGLLWRSLCMVAAALSLS
jgi:hypothetical protein